jgi:signal transduction histidine kinase
MTRLLPRPRLPRRTLRLRLTLLYGGVFFISGVTLLAITYGLLIQTTVASTRVGEQAVIRSVLGPGPPLSIETRVRRGSSLPEPSVRVERRSRGVAPVPSPGAHPSASQLEELLHSRPARAPIATLVSHQHVADLHELLTVSLIALAIMAAASMALGWLIAGRVLRPLRTITTAARDISATNLHERLALEGPNDELKELGDTFDGLLARLDASFQSQRQFVANASHELRTPLARLKTLIQVALSDPNATEESLRATHERVLASEEQLERLIESLLSLASSERSLDRREALDLRAVTEEALSGRRPEIQRRGLRLNATLEPARTTGNPQLVERLVANLIDNAILHNTATGGRIDLATATMAEQAVLSIANSGPVIPPEELERLQRPFQRLGADRTSSGEGHGLGLSIVHAIAEAHGATVSTRARPDGGLEVEVSFPAPGK